jgi:acyl carrier protein
MQNLNERVKNVLVDLDYIKPDTEINGNITIQGDLDLDSLDSVEFIMAIEDEFGIEIDDNDSEKMKTLGDVIEYLKKRLS